jgi:mannose-6-phosphate isomerase-like protein (cupin superfamily)
MINTASGHVPGIGLPGHGAGSFQIPTRFRQASRAVKGRQIMPVFKKPRPIHHAADNPVEKHFHDHDETWVILGGKAKACMIDRDGHRMDFTLEQGDVWMIEAGVEHGCEPFGDKGLDLFTFAGTIPDGAHKPGHYNMEKEHYMPTLCLRKTPIDRYRRGGDCV